MEQAERGHGGGSNASGLDCVRAGSFVDPVPTQEKSESSGRMTNSADRLRILVVDDHPLLREGIVSLVGKQADMQIVAEASNGEEALPLFEQHSPDITLMDVRLPGMDGIDTMSAILGKRPDAKVIVLTSLSGDAQIARALKAGARGYLLKSEVGMQIAWAIVYALDHDFIISPAIEQASEQIFNTRLIHSTVLPGRREYPELTERIRQAIELCVVEGMPAHLAADEMGISLHTIRSYIKEGYRILEAYDETEYPVDMSPQERAFMRLTRFTDEPEEK